MSADKRALAEIIIVRRRRLVVGQIENADIDRGNHDPGLFAGGEAAELHRQLQGRVRAAPAPAASDRRVSVLAARRWRTIARRWRGPACAAPAHRAAGASVATT